MLESFGDRYRNSSRSVGSGILFLQPIELPHGSLEAGGNPEVDAGSVKLLEDIGHALAGRVLNDVDRSVHSLPATDDPADRYKLCSTHEDMEMVSGAARMELTDGKVGNRSKCLTREVGGEVFE